MRYKRNFPTKCPLLSLLAPCLSIGFICQQITLQIYNIKLLHRKIVLLVVGVMVGVGGGVGLYADRFVENQMITYVTLRGCVANSFRKSLRNF